MTDLKFRPTLLKLVFQNLESDYKVNKYKARNVRMGTVSHATWGKNLQSRSSFNSTNTEI